MSKPQPSWEELAAEHGVDPALFKGFQEGLDRASAAQGRWVAWRKPVLEQARQIEALIKAHPQQEVHPLDRPGIGISQRGQLGEDLQLFIDVPGYRWLSLKFDAFEGITICGKVDAPSAHDQVVRSVHAIGELNRSWDSQPPAVRNNWPVPFEGIEHVLSCVHNALLNNTPLGPSADWGVALRDHFSESLSEKATPKRWAHWVQTWGTTDMISSFHMVDGLFDGEQDPKAWREHLLRSWLSQTILQPLDAPGLDFLGDEPN